MVRANTKRRKGVYFPLYLEAYPVSTDAWLAGSIAVTQLVTGIYGVVVSIAEGQLKIAMTMGVIGGLGVALTVFATVRSDRAQQSLQAQLTEIKHNTEQPPQVTVNVPPTPPSASHGHLDFFQTSVPNDAKLDPFREGQVADVNILFKADGGVVSSAVLKAIVVVVPVKDFGEAKISTYKKRIDVADSAVSGTLMPSELGNFRTFYSKPLSSDEASSLNQSKAGVCAIGVMSWQDDSGKYQTDTGRCYAIEIDGNHQWHALPFNGQETKLP